MESSPDWSLVIARSFSRDGAVSLYHEWLAGHPVLARTVADKDVSIGIVKTKTGGASYQVRLLRLEDCRAMEAKIAVLLVACQDARENGVSQVCCPACMENITFTPVTDHLLAAACPCGLIKDTIGGL